MYKKLIANVNYGLLEKGGATDQKSIVFKNLKEALNYQAEYGGKIHKLTHFTTERITVDEEQYTSEEEQAAYYILNLKDTSRLRNGFRYVKELFTIQRSDITKTRELLIFNNEIGGWRVSNAEYIKFPTVDYEVSQNELIQIPVYESKTIDIVDEYDTDNIIEIIEQIILLWFVEHYRARENHIYVKKWLIKIIMQFLFVLLINYYRHAKAKQ